MKLPLLIALRPKHSKQGGLIPLGNGRWRITANNKDSVLSLASDDIRDVEASLIPCTVNGPIHVRVVVLSPGSEESIDSFAEHVT